MNKKQNKAEHSPAPQPERAIYGFFLLISSLIAFILFVAVSVTPDSWLDYYQLDFLPGKYWSIAAPAFLILIVLLILPFYYTLNMTKVNPLEVLTCVKDEQSLSKCNQRARDVKYSKYSIDPAYDIPVEEINRFVFMKD